MSWLRHSPPDRARRFGLRTRVVISFGIGAALVSGALALITFTVVRRDLLAHRQTSSLRQAYANARLVKEKLEEPSTDVADVLTTLAPAGGVQSFVNIRGVWFSASASVGGTPASPELLHTVLAGNTAEQRIIVNGEPTIVVGIPFPSLGAAYFEDHSVTDIQQTLNLLATVLATTAVATTVGGALVGYWASRRLFRPLANVALVATDIAAGTLDRRLPGDRDLEPLVTSFNDMVTNLQQRIEREERFASDVSHELRSPLSTINASVELLASYRDLLPAEGRTTVDTLGFEVERFSGMVQDLLEMSRIDAGVPDLNVTDLPLDELVLRTVGSHDPNIEVRIAPEATGVRVRGDKRRLQRVVANLLDNADIHAGGAVLVTVDNDGSWAAIAVEDRGPGVKPEDRTRAFERFYRGAASGRRGSTAGTGLGLALVAEHVRAHHGTVRIEDGTPAGARFVVELPVGGP